MKPLTSEWVEKAEGDFATASREIRVRARLLWRKAYSFPISGLVHVVRSIRA